MLSEREYMKSDFKINKNKEKKYIIKHLMFNMYLVKRYIIKLFNIF